MRRFLLLALGFLPLLGSCSRPLRAPGTLRLAQDNDASTLDPALSYDTTSIGFVRVLYRGLVDYDARANIINAVAKSRTVSPDGLTYTFTLRPDAKFTTGTLNGKAFPARRVTADDFRFALERVLDPATQSDGLSMFTMIQGAKEFSADRAKPVAQRKLAHCEGISVRGDDVISFRLTKADTTFLNYLALPFGYAVRPEWVRALEKSGQNLSDNPNGNGPFRFVSWTHDALIVLEKNPDYYDKRFPKANRLEVEMGNPAELQMMRFERGDNDVFSLGDLRAPSDFVRFKNDPKWKPRLLSAPQMDVRYVILNNEMAPFNNKLVRQAMNCAVNKKRILAFRAGRAEVARGILPPGMPAYNPKLRGYDFDPARARQLLKQAGYKNNPSKPITFWFAVRNEPWYPQAALSIQQDLKRIGMTVQLKAVTYPELKVAAGHRKTCQMAMIGWIQDFPDPSNFLDVLLNGERITDNASNNRAFYNNPRVNTILNAAISEPNRVKRLGMYSQAEQMVMDDAPWVPLNHTTRYFVTQPWVSGYRLDPAWNMVLETVAVNE